MKLGHIVEYHKVFFKFIVPCIQELLAFVHPNMSFLALRKYGNFAYAGAYVSHGHTLVFQKFVQKYYHSVIRFGSRSGPTYCHA